MYEYKYIVSRGNTPCSEIEFEKISDALAYIYGIEFFNERLNVEYVIKKISKSKNNVLQNEE